MRLHTGFGSISCCKQAGDYWISWQKDLGAGFCVLCILQALSHISNGPSGLSAKRIWPKCVYVLKVRQSHNIFFKPTILPKNELMNGVFCLTVLWSNCFVHFLEEFEDRKKSFSCGTFDSFLAGLGRNWMAYKSISSCPFFWRVTSSWFRTRALILSLTSKGTGKVRNLNRSTKRNVIQWRKIHLSHLQF